MNDLTEEQIEQIAERAAAKAVAKMTDIIYQEIGKTMVKRFFWFVGLIAVGAFAGAKLTGWKL